MKQKRSDIFLLLVILLMFSASVGILHGRKKAKTQLKHQNAMTHYSTLTQEEALKLIQPLLYAHSINTIANIFRQFSTTVIEDVLKAVVHDPASPLDNQEKAQLLLAVVHSYATKKDVRSSLFNLIKTYYESNQEVPILFIAASKYISVIVDLLTWMNINAQSLIPIWTDQALEQAIRENNLTILELLYAQGVRADAQQASKLLHQVVSGNKNIEFVPFLVRRSGANVNYSHDGKRTVLIEAVENNNQAMVRALLEEDADPSIVLDPATGTATQIAFEKGYVQVEQLLRSQE